MYPKLGTLDKKYYIFNQMMSLCSVDFNIQHSTTSQIHNTDEIDQFYIISFGCLEKNISKVFELLQELITSNT